MRHLAARTVALGLTAASPAVARDGDGLLPLYTEDVVLAVWAQLDEELDASCRWPRGDPDAGLPPLRCEPASLRMVALRGEQFTRLVSEDPRILHLVGLAYRFADDRRAAIAALTRASRLPDPPVAVFSDLGELQAIEGDLDAARTAFEAVTVARAAGPSAWYGWLQLAQLDVRQRRADDLGTHLRLAVRHGLDLRWLVGNPLWVSAAKDPTLRPVLARAAQVYAPPDVAEALLPGKDR